MTDRVRLQALVTPWQLLVATGGATLVLLAVFGTSDVGAMTWRLRLAGVAVVGTAAFFFDDPAAATLAASPTPLRVRRMHRLVFLAASAGMWWAAATVLVRVRYAVEVPGTFAFELVASGVVAVAVSLAVGRWCANETPGALGAAVAPSWFALGYVPRPEWIAVPPQPGGSGTSVLLCVTLAALVLMMVASRDPCSRIVRSRANRPP